MTALRLHLLLATALLAAGCAQQPQKGDYTAPTAVPASASASATPLASAFPAPLLMFAYEQGWRQVVVTGNDHYFCRSDAPSGSLIPSARCVTESQLEFLKVTAEQQQQQLIKPIPLDRGS